MEVCCGCEGGGAEDGIKSGASLAVPMGKAASVVTATMVSAVPTPAMAPAKTMHKRPLPDHRCEMTPGLAVSMSCTSSSSSSSRQSASMPASGPNLPRSHTIARRFIAYLPCTV